MWLGGEDCPGVWTDVGLNPHSSSCVSVRGIVTNTPDQAAYRTDRDFSQSWGLEVQDQGAHQCKSITLGCSPAGLGLWGVLIAHLVGCGLWPLLLGLVLSSLCRAECQLGPRKACVSCLSSHAICRSQIAGFHTPARPRLPRE